MADKVPPSRPALRKSVDATVHPALGGRSGSHTLQPSPPQARTKPTPVPQVPPPKAGRPIRKSRASTSDVLRPTKQDPPVTVKLTVPKSMRRVLRSLAKEENVATEVLAVRLLAERLQQLQRN